MAEVLDQLAPEERDVALRLSVLDWFDPELCRNLAGSRAVPVLHELQRKRLFPHGHRRAAGGATRLDPLFRELLESELRWRDPELRLSRLHRRAAELWQERGDLNDAYRHLLKLPDPEAAWALVVQPVLDLVDRGDRAGLAAMMRRLPDAVRVDEPSLAMDLATAWLFAGSETEATACCDLAESLIGNSSSRAAGASSDVLRLRLHTLRAALAMMRGALDTAAVHIRCFEELAGYVSSHDPLVRRFATVAARVALASGCSDDARRWVERAVANGGPDWVASVTVPALQAWLALAYGTLPEATRVADEASRRADELGMRPHSGALEALVISGSVYLGGGELAAAARRAEEARSDADVLGLTWLQVRAGVLVADVRRHIEGPRAALEVIDELRLTLGRRPLGQLGDDLDGAEARALLGCGRVEAARRLVDAMDDGPGRRLLAARTAGPRPATVEDLLADRKAWTVAERRRRPLPSRRRRRGRVLDHERGQAVRLRSRVRPTGS